MKILITGATGLVGSKLIEDLYLNGHEDIRVLTRNIETANLKIPFPVEIKRWNPVRGEIDADSLENVDIIFHLAGESVAGGRWNQSRKTRILDSRILSTTLLLNEIKKSSTTPKKFISASAVGIYGDTNSIEINEESELANDYLAQVCKDWEATLKNSNIEGMQKHVLRTGIVLSKNGGALEKMLTPFKMGAGGILGSGKQYMSWIHIDDLIKSYIFLMKHNCKHFAYNGVSPDPVNNKEFTKRLGSQLKRPTIFPVPKFVLQLIFGEMSQILLEGQKVLPTRLLDEGFSFKYKKLEHALAHEFSYDSKGEVLYKQYQWVPKRRDEVFTFFSNERNLESITPPSLGFKVLKMTTDKIQEGTLIDYKLRIHGMPAHWQTKISKFTEGESFIDEQLKGPYKKWIHQHDFIDSKNGTLICDKITYKLPMGSIGNLVAGWFVQRDVTNIFNFRKKVIRDIF